MQNSTDMVRITRYSLANMSHQRDDESRLVEIDAALELLRQIKEDTVTVILSLQNANRRNRLPPRTDPAMHSPER